MSDLVNVAIGDQIVTMPREAAGLDPLPSPDEALQEWAGVFRGQRDKLLAECDWVVLRAQELGAAVPTDWTTYRQALRDVSAQEGFPMNIVWPVKP